jgi:hypothetical protein
MPDPERDLALMDLPADGASSLGDLRAAAQAALGAQLVSMVLYGSGAEGRLRATSDVNIILILSAFDAEKLARLRDPLRVAEAAIRLRPMVLVQDEIRGPPRRLRRSSATSCADGGSCAGRTRLPGCRSRERSSWHASARSS